MGVTPRISQQAGRRALVPPKLDRGATGTKTFGLKSGVKSRVSVDSQVKAARARSQLQGPGRSGPLLPLRPCRSGAALRFKKHTKKRECG